ncbi:hypothetical protein ACFQ6V_22625, partial [Streptomyces roseifaciens]
MSVWQRARARRTVVGAALTAALALTLSACGSDDKEEKPNTDRSVQGGSRDKQDSQSKQDSPPKQSDNTKVV